MATLSPVESLRLRNLRVLHGRPIRYGAPTSAHLVQFLGDKGLSIANSDLTQIYQETQTITESLASGVEQAFNLPSGWLSANHEFVYELSPTELSAHALLAELPLTVRERIYSLVEGVAKLSKPD